MSSLGLVSVGTGAALPAGMRIGVTEAGLSEVNGLAGVCREAIVLVTSMVGRLRAGSLAPPPAAPPPLMGGSGDLMASGPGPREGKGRV